MILPSCCIFSFAVELCSPYKGTFRDHDSLKTLKLNNYGAAKRRHQPLDKIHRNSFVSFNGNSLPQLISPNMSRVRPILASGTRYRPILPASVLKKILRYQPRYCARVTKTIVLCFDCAHQRKKQHPSALECHANRYALHHNHSWTPQCYGR